MTGDNNDWATMADQEDWKTDHNKSRLEKRDFHVQEVLVASCSDDGTVRLWHPVEVYIVTLMLTTTALSSKMILCPVN